MNRTSPRRYNTGENIPNHGEVVRTSDTAYLVLVVEADDEYYEWVPFYGPNGVDHPSAVEPLVVLS